ncbi:aryl-sulfate sulfotransferase [bacterium]|nr:aryl-sulfate sulfotransferase [bacterium]
MKNTLFVALITLLFAGTLHGSVDDYQFIAPVPGSEYNTRETTVIIRHGDFIDAGSLSVVGALTVSGSISGPVSGRIILSSDGRTVIFAPDDLFVPGEHVTVAISRGIRTLTGEAIPECEFNFTIAPFPETLNPYAVCRDLRPFDSDVIMKRRSGRGVPDDFPGITVDVCDSSQVDEGYIFLTVSAEVEGIGYYLMILDNQGTPWWYKKLTADYAYDFKVQPAGCMSYGQFIEHHSYTGGGDVIHMIMDTTMAVIDSVQMKNGYVAEGHDFQMLENGHILLFGYYLTQVDMSQYADGGQPDALVSGGVIQELDQDRNVIFQWRSWDHYSFVDYDWGRGSRSAIIAAFHLNAISLDTDGHILLGSPSFSMKINRQTGEVIWMLGGDESEFMFTGAEAGDAAGHTFHRTSEGTILVFNNGNRTGSTSSMVNEFIIDESALTAESYWTYTPDTSIASWHRGSAQRLPNGNTFIGWGGASGKAIPAATEVTPSGEKVFELHFDHPDVESYRAFRFPLPQVRQGVRATEYEVAVGNSYEFVDGEGNETGVNADITGLSGDGYNSLTVTQIPYAPVNAAFPGKAPRVFPWRIYIGETGIGTITADLYFDTSLFGLHSPEEVVVYFRMYGDQGLFIPLPTTYNPVTGKLKTTMTNFGEFVFGIPDHPVIALSPLINAPEAGEKMNQDLPVTMRWSTQGYALYYRLQVSPNDQFSTLVLDEVNLTDENYSWTSAEDNQVYYWRVRTENDAEVSEWASSWFETVPPYIEITHPNGGEQLQRGLPSFIRWNDNIDEDVVLKLYTGGQYAGDIATTASDGAYSWDIDPYLTVGGDYAIVICSGSDTTLADMSDSAFAVIDTTGTGVTDIEAVEEFALLGNYPNPFNPGTLITYLLPVQSDVTLTVFDIRGRVVVRLEQGMRDPGRQMVCFTSEDDYGQVLPAGIYLYRLQAVPAESNGYPPFTASGKMLLVK